MVPPGSRGRGGRARPPRPLESAQVGTIASDAVSKAIKDEQAAPPASAVVYQKIFPSLVAIETRGPSSKGNEEGLGTGVIVNMRGSILTAFHVIDGAGPRCRRTRRAVPGTATTSSPRAT